MINTHNQVNSNIDPAFYTFRKSKYLATNMYKLKIDILL